MFSFGPNDIVEVKAPLPFHIFCLRNPDHIKFISINKYSSLRKPDYTLPKANFFMGNGLFNDFGDREAWKKKRLTFNPIFSPENSHKLCAPVVAAVQETKSRWIGFGEKSFNLYEEILRLVLDYSFRSLYSTELGPDLDWVKTGTAFAEMMFTTQVPYWIPTPSNIKFFLLRRRFRKLMKKIIQHRLDHPSEQKDVVHPIVQNYPAGSCPFTGLFKKARLDPDMFFSSGPAR